MLLEVEPPEPPELELVLPEELPELPEATVVLAKVPKYFIVPTVESAA